MSFKGLIYSFNWPLRLRVIRSPSNNRDIETVYESLKGTLEFYVIVVKSIRNQYNLRQRTRK